MYLTDTQLSQLQLDTTNCEIHLYLQLIIARCTLDQLSSANSRPDELVKRRLCKQQLCTSVCVSLCVCVWESLKRSPAAHSIENS